MKIYASMGEKALRWVLSATVGAVALVLAGIELGDVPNVLGTSFPGFLLYENGIVAPVHVPGWAGAKADIRYPSIVTGVNDSPVTSAGDLYTIIQNQAERTSLRFTVKASSSTFQASVPLRPVGWWDLAASVGLFWIDGIVFIGFGIWFLLRMTKQAARWSLFFVLLTLGLWFLMVPDFMLTHRMTIILHLGWSLLPSAGFCLALYFPVPLPFAARRPILIPALLICFPGLLDFVLYRLAVPYPGRYVWVDHLAYTMAFSAAVAIMTSFSGKLSHVERADHKVGAQAFLLLGVVPVSAGAIIVFFVFFSDVFIPVNVIAVFLTVLWVFTLPFLPRQWRYLFA